MDFLGIRVEDLVNSPIALGIIVTVIMQLLLKKLIDNLIGERQRGLAWRDVIVNAVTFVVAVGVAWIATGFTQLPWFVALQATAFSVLGYELPKNIIDGVKEDLKWR